MQQRTEAPENTAERPAIVHLAGSLSDPSSYITDMEAAGQRQLVASTVLPKEGPWDELIELGFVRGAEQDSLFVQAELPSGWTREGSDHAMWSYLLDERGIRRVGVFYKAAFYDRRADMSLHNVGHSAATDALYGDEFTAPEKWALFNADERAAFVAGLAGMDERIAECSQVYGKYAPRLAEARAWLAGQS